MIETLKNLHKTFYCGSFYRDLLTRWKGIGAGFLLVVTFINLLNIYALAAGPLRIFLEEQAPALTTMPSLTIKDGVISSEPSAPHLLSLLKNHDEGPINMLIDTQAEPMDEPTLIKKMQDEKLLVYIAKDSVSIYDPIKGVLDTKPSKNMENQSITQEDWKNLSDILSGLFMPMMAVFLFATLFAGHLLTAFAGAILLWIISPLFKAKLAIQPAMRLASAAKIPVAVIFVVLTPEPVMQTLIWFGFAIYGLLAAKKVTPSTTSSC